MFVCKQEDEFTELKARWVAILDNGETILQDDGRPGAEPASAWLRLREYIRDDRLKIRRLYLQHRSNIVTPLPDDAAGYFFCNRAVALLFDNNTYGFYVVGYLTKDNQIETQVWKVPELLLAETGVRSAEEADLFLIRNNYE